MTQCKHINTTPHYDHLRCNDCGSVHPDSAYGSASYKWFSSFDEVAHYRKTGQRFPEASPPTDTVIISKAEYDALVADKERLLKALKDIKFTVVGDTIPYWADKFATSTSRTWIANICDQAIDSAKGK